MRLRIVEQPWEVAGRRYVIEQRIGEVWCFIAVCEGEGEARDYAALYGKGPRVVEEFDFTTSGTVACTGQASQTATPALSS